MKYYYNFYLSVLQGFYIFYMFNYFKTTYTINHPFESIITKNIDFIKHPINKGIYENKICQLGNLVGYLLLIWFIIRNLIPFKLINIKKINNLIIYSILIACLIMNFNAFIYFFPLFIINQFYEIH